MDELEKQTASVISAEQLSTVPKLNLGPLPETAPQPETATKIKPKVKLKVEKSTATKVIDNSKIDLLTKRIKALEKEVFLLKNKTEEDFKDIDQNLEEHFTILYKNVNNLKDEIHVGTGDGSSRKIEDKKDRPKSGFFDRVTRKIMNAKNPTIKDMLSIVGKEGVKTAKRAIDPRNIAKNFFGSNLGAAVIGKMMGKDDRTTKKYLTNEDGSPMYEPKEKKEPQSTSTKIPSLNQTSNPNDILYNIYDLMKKSADEDKLQRELDADYAEQRKKDKEKKHKELLEAIQSMSLGNAKGDSKEEKELEKETGGGVVDFILNLVNAFGGMEKLAKIGALLVNPVTLTSLGIIAATGLAAYVGTLLRDSLEERERRSDYERGGQEAVEAKQRMKAQYNPLDESGILTDNNEKFQSAKKDYDAAVKKKQSASTPASPSASTPPATPTSMPKATPAPAAPKSDVLNKVVAENAKQKLEEDTTPAKPIVMNNSNVSGSSQSANPPSPPIAKVRDRDDTMGRLLSNSTRVV